MCGIAGIANLAGGPPPTKAELVAMAGTLVHRGPDGQGVHVAPGIGLAHRRLSIIDLEHGQQPIHNEDRSIWVVFNGEIFNYPELRHDLRDQGHRFYTDTDTEVLVHLYEQHDLDFVHLLNGQFAFALWDARRARLVLARDRPGILPLYHAEHRGRLVFASEIKALFPVVGRPSRLSHRALDQLFTFWAPQPPETMFEGVAQLAPGEMLVLESGRARRSRYWDFDFSGGGEREPAGDANDAEAIEEVKALLIDATRIRLRADVPVGAYLSGGLDSSILATVIRRYTDSPLRTFSIGFDDAALDESDYQDAMAAQLDTQHSRIHCRKQDIAGAFARAVWHGESALLRTAPAPMMLLSGLVRQSGYKVVLTGEGADEIFGGYDLFKETKVRRFWARSPDSTRRPLLLKRLYPYLDLSASGGMAYLKAFFGEGLDKPDAPLFSHLLRLSTTIRCKEFLAPEVRRQLQGDARDALLDSLPPQFARWHWLRRAQYLECRTLLSPYLLSSQGDRMLMANSIEGRFPFLDHRLIERAGRLDPLLLMRALDEKHVLKRAFGAELPPLIVGRKKQPYRAPGSVAFLQGEAREQTRDVLGRDALVRAGYFDAARVELLVRKLEAGVRPSERDNMAFLGVLSTQLLHRQFVDEYPARIEPRTEPT